jgi:branched-chain amino acid transport system substrate-binding protein
VLIAAIQSVAIEGEDGSLYIPREALVTAVRGTSGFEGTTGTVTCDEVGECNATGPAVFIVEGGDWVTVER